MFPDLNSKSAMLFKRAAKSFPGGSSRHLVMYKPYTDITASLMLFNSLFKSHHLTALKIHQNLVNVF